MTWQLTSAGGSRTTTGWRGQYYPIFFLAKLGEGALQEDDVEGFMWLLKDRQKINTITFKNETLRQQNRIAYL